MEFNIKRGFKISFRLKKKMIRYFNYTIYLFNDLSYRLPK